MTGSFELIMQHEPPLLAVIVGPWDHTFNVLKECIIAVPAADTVVRIGSFSGVDIDKFETHGLTQVSGNEVIAPLIRECKAISKEQYDCPRSGSGKFKS